MKTDKETDFFKILGEIRKALEANKKHQIETEVLLSQKEDRPYRLKNWSGTWHEASFQ